VYISGRCRYSWHKLKALASENKITVEYRALGFLDRFSGGTKLLLACRRRGGMCCRCFPGQVPGIPGQAVRGAAQGKQQGPGQCDAEEVRHRGGAADITSCVDEKKFRPYVANTTGLATVHGVSATPTVFMDGQQWQSPESFDDFSKRILDAKK